MNNKRNDSRGARSGSSSRAHRISPEAQQEFKDRRNEKSDQSYESAPRPRNRPEVEKRPDNVSLSLSPKMLELADELASNARMPLRTFLTEALKYIILAQGKRLGVSEKYLPEFVNQNSRKISTWKPDSEKAQLEQGSARSNYRSDNTYERSDRSRPSYQSRSDSHRSESADRGDRPYRTGGSKFRSQDQSKRRPWVGAEGQSDRSGSTDRGDRPYRTGGSKFRSQDQSKRRPWVGAEGQSDRSGSTDRGDRPYRTGGSKFRSQDQSKRKPWAGAEGRPQRPENTDRSDRPYRTGGSKFRSPAQDQARPWSGDGESSKPRSSGFAKKFAGSRSGKPAYGKKKPYPKARARKSP